VRALILDSEAISRLARPSSRKQDAAIVHEYLTAAVTTRSPIRVPAAVLAEQYRGRGYDQAVDALLSRHEGVLMIVDTDRDLARSIGNLLARHGRGTEDHVDAAVVATAARCGGGVILTSDQGDVTELAEGLPNITVTVLR